MSGRAGARDGARAASGTHDDADGKRLDCLAPRCPAGHLDCAATRAMPMTSQSTFSSGRIVVAMDFSEQAITAARWVAQHFARGAELVLVHVLHVPPRPRFLRMPHAAADRLVDTARVGAEARLRELSASIATALIWPEVRVGKPDEEVVRVAADYDARLIVVGRPPVREGARGRVGITVRRILARSDIPVLSVGTVPRFSSWRWCRGCPVRSRSGARRRRRRRGSWGR